MSKDIGQIVSQAIIEKKLLKITYENKSGSTTSFIIGIKQIDFKYKRLYVSLLNEHYYLNENSFKDDRDTFIYFDRIKSAYILDLTTYNQPPQLIPHLQKYKKLYRWLGFDLYSHNILEYYKECNILNGDPARNDYQDILGIDAKVLAREKIVHLNEEQNKQIFERVLDEFNRQHDMKIFTLILNRLSISRPDGKIYVIAYNIIRYNPIAMNLVLEKEISFNLSFVYFKDAKKSLDEFIDGDVEDWMDEYKKDPHTAIERLNLRYEERADTKPHIMMIEQKMSDYIPTYYNHIAENFENNKLNKPLKAFFGRYSSIDNTPRKVPFIVAIDSKLNRTQLRVIYNALKYPITYVQGPPGTGKTQTILNVVLSNYLLDRTTLICSNNNQAVESVLSKFKVKYNGEDVPIPYLRLGNLSINEEAIDKILELYNYETKDFLLVAKQTSPHIKNMFKIKNLDVIDHLESDSQYERLTKLIKDYHQLVDDTKEFKQFSDNLEKNLKTIEEDKEKYKELDFDRIEGQILSLSKDIHLTRYFYYYCLSKIQKLKSDEYIELIKIALMENKATRIIEFNKYISNPANFKKLTDVFPMIFSTNISSHRLGGPEFSFDLVIMDEAGQCDIPNALIPISKANNLLLVGDIKQLKPVITITKETEDRLIKEFNIKDPYKYSFYHNSIYSTMTKTDLISNQFMLDYHYRSGKKIIDFSNKRYYDSHLQILTNVEDSLELYDINNEAMDQKNTWINEASEIVKYIERNNVDDCQIVTPFHNQAELLNDMLEKENLTEKAKAGTIHSLQGSEKNTIIFSTAISKKTSQRTYEWLKNNQEIINVGVTRAKQKLVVFADTEAIKYKSKNRGDDISLLIDYVKSKGKLTIPSSNDINVTYGKSNHSINEDQLFKTIALYCEAHKTYIVKRNVSVKELANNRSGIGKNYEYDFVIYKKNGNDVKPHLIIELNGGEHLGTITRERNDQKKREIAKDLGVKIIAIPNTYSKRYDYIDLLLNNKTTSY